MRRKFMPGLLASNVAAILLASAVNGGARPADEVLIKGAARPASGLAADRVQYFKFAQTIMPAPAASNSGATDAPPAPPAAVAPPAEPTISDKLRDILTSPTRGDRIITRKGERAAVDAFYQKRNYQPLWVEQGRPSSRAQAVLDYMKTIDADGLDPSDYMFPNFTATSLEGQAETEARFTAVFLTYARHAMNGRVHWSRVTANAVYKDNYDASEVLNRITDASDVKAALDSLQPPHAAYKALKQKLAELRAQTGESGPRIPYGPYLKYGNEKFDNKSKNAKDKGKSAKDKSKTAQVVMMQDPRVPLIREKLGLPPKDDINYDKELAQAVAKFQERNGLKPDGQVGNPTIDALNGPTREGKINMILANMERWRWVPRDLGKTHVVLNIPDFHLRVYNEGQQIWKTRVVVGKPSQATPLLSETMKFITVNPVWNVPQSIIYQELLPIFETSDPGIFVKQGLKVEHGRDGIRVYQPPGDRNALGRLRFNFPNKYLVYQHDTSEKHLFAHERRAYSHGCMRVQDPLRYAEILLRFAVPNEKYTQERIRRMYSDSEINIDFKVHIPVHITYQTAFVDENGELQLREDLYGLDAKYASIMKGSERRVADVAIDRPADPNYKPTPTDLARLANVPRDGGGWDYGNDLYGRRGDNPFSFFGRLFR
jgi:murein L,D-transpeptidase YcbB/YkuD